MTDTIAATIKHLHDKDARIVADPDLAAAIAELQHAEARIDRAKDALITYAMSKTAKGKDNGGNL